MEKTENIINLDQPIKLGRTNIEVDCLAFTDDLAILARDVGIEKIEILKETAEKVGLQISLKKKQNT